MFPFCWWKRFPKLIRLVRCRLGIWLDGFKNGIKIIFVITNKKGRILEKAYAKRSHLQKQWLQLQVRVQELIQEWEQWMGLPKEEGLRLSFSAFQVNHVKKLS